MATKEVLATRVELTHLSKQLTTAKKGHKLLKDKQDELVRQFIILVKDNQRLRKKMEQTLQERMKKYVLASSTIPDYILEESFAIPMQKVGLDVNFKTIMNMDVPVLNEQYDDDYGEEDFSYGFVNTTSELDQSLTDLDDILPLMLQLAEIEKTCQMMADEIERTRRRVNSLEHMTIPNLTDTIAYIERTLDESERSNLTRLMKVIDITSEEN